MEIKGKNIRNVISGLKINLIRALIRGGLPCMAVDPLSRSATIKGGHVGTRESTFTMLTVPPQTLATKTDQEDAEARESVHLASNRRPPTPNPDHHRHHVVLLVGSRYIHVISRL
jgi:hypothetical protein